jgi:Flp pilus assembly pilin Flp
MKLEYALILVLVAGALITGMEAVGKKLGATFEATAGATAGGSAPVTTGASSATQAE